MINPTRDDLGRRVVYTLNFGENSVGEVGILTSFNDDFAFVRYGADAQSKMTLRRHLEWEIGGDSVQ